jgi:cytochrome P450
VAGHETTATLLSWIIVALTQRPDIQRALRTECRGSPLPRAPHGNDPLSVDALAAVDKLPLLDAVVRETLRLHAPVPSTVRAATRADTLPLSAPFMDREGKERTSVPMRKGEVVVIPVRLVNRAEAIWGADAGEWRCSLFLCSQLTVCTHAL